MTPLPSFPHPPQSLSSEIRIGSLNLNVWQQIIINLYIYICRCVYVYVPSNQEALVMSGMQLRLIRDIEGGDTGGAIGHHALCSNHYSTLKGHYLHRQRGESPPAKQNRFTTWYSTAHFAATIMGPSSLLLFSSKLGHDERLEMK